MTPLKLKEIIWEVTLKCSNGCKYCGSKTVLRRDNPPFEQLDRIAQEIVSYGVNTVTLSGGEPGELPSEHLDHIIQTLTDGGIDVRIVTNGKILAQWSWYKQIDKVTCIGLSVNEEWPYWFDYVDGHEKDITIITNFGTHNVWQFDALSEFVRSSGFGTWQIQLTMGEFQLPPNGISYLRERIRNHTTGVSYILADNLQDEHTCSAGISTCGITADGDVIACLSERACNNGIATPYGNLNKQTLKEIWESQFKDIRFGAGYTHSCRKCIKYPAIERLTPTIAPKPATPLPEQPIELPDPYKPLEVTLYGVRPYEGTIVYGVGTYETKVMAYAVQMHPSVDSSTSSDAAKTFQTIVDDALEDKVEPIEEDEDYTRAWRDEMQRRRRRGMMFGRDPDVLAYGVVKHDILGVRRIKEVNKK